MWELVGDLTSSWVTVFLTTQYLEEADRLADRIAVMDGGRIVAQGTATQLKAAVGGERLDLTLVDASAFDQVRDRLGPRAVHGERSMMTLGVACAGHADAVRSLLDELDPARGRRRPPSSGAPRSCAR